MRDTLRINGAAVDVSVKLRPDGGASVKVGGEEYEVTGVQRSGGELEFSYGGVIHRYSVLATPQSVEVGNGAVHHRLARIEAGAPEEEESAGELTSQMPGTVLKILAPAGSTVTKGTPLLILEAMKMEHEVCAPETGTVTGYPHAEGTRVMPGDLLVEFEPQ